MKLGELLKANRSQYCYPAGTWSTEHHDGEIEVHAHLWLVPTWILDLEVKVELQLKQEHAER